MKRPALLRLLTLSMLLGAASCAGNSESNVVQPGQLIGGGTRQMPVAAAPGNFLPQPALLHPGARGEADLLYIAPGANPAAYTQIMLDPVTILSDPGSDWSKVPAQQQSALANTFYTELRKDLAAHCDLATAPGPNVIRIRLALVDAKSTNPVVTTVAIYAPYVSAAYSLEALTLNHGVGAFAGTATAEGFATNAATGALLWEGVDRRGGTTALIENTTDRWLDVHHILTQWSSQLSQRLQRLAACRP